MKQKLLLGIFFLFVFIYFIVCSCTVPIDEQIDSRFVDIYIEISPYLTWSITSPRYLASIYIVPDDSSGYPDDIFNNSIITLNSIACTRDYWDDGFFVCNNPNFLLRSDDSVIISIRSPYFSEVTRTATVPNSPTNLQLSNKLDDFTQGVVPNIQVSWDAVSCDTYWFVFSRYDASGNPLVGFGGTSDTNSCTFYSSSLTNPSDSLTASYISIEICSENVFYNKDFVNSLICVKSPQKLSINNVP
jgi:hypothetical protein